MKHSLLLLVVLALLVPGNRTLAQATSSTAEVVTTYSQNEKYYLRTIPFDNVSPSLRGTASVYEVGREKPLYTFSRGFDSVDEDSNNLILSDDGRTIFYAITWGADESVEGLKSVSIYKDGQLVRSYTESEVTGCDEKKERCELAYSNYEEVVDKEKSKWGTPLYKKVFKTGVSEQEKFLNEYPIFTHDDTVYLTDSKKNTHLFDLKSGELVRTVPFDQIYDKLKPLSRLNKTRAASFNTPFYPKFPKMKNGLSSSDSLARFIGMKPADTMAKADEQYKLYTLVLSGYLSKDGTFDIEKLDAGDGLPKDKIQEFFKTNKLDSSLVPSVADKWYLDEEYFYFRNANDNLARQEKREEQIRQREELKRRLVAEKINDIYIPKNLGECFTELDRLLPEVDKKEMLDLPKRDEMIRYHMGLGMWMRNNWGLWGGSRLQTYFASRGIRHPDDMSSVVLFYYYDWLKGNKDSWKEWENKPKQPFS